MNNAYKIIAKTLLFFTVMVSPKEKDTSCENSCNRTLTFQQKNQTKASSSPASSLAEKTDPKAEKTDPEQHTADEPLPPPPPHPNQTTQVPFSETGPTNTESTASDEQTPALPTESDQDARIKKDRLVWVNTYQKDNKMHCIFKVPAGNTKEYTVSLINAKEKNSIPFTTDLDTLIFILPLLDQTVQYQVKHSLSPKVLQGSIAIKQISQQQPSHRLDNIRKKGLELKIKSMDTDKVKWDISKVEVSFTAKKNILTLKKEEFTWDVINNSLHITPQVFANTKNSHLFIFLYGSSVEQTQGLIQLVVVTAEVPILKKGK